MNVQSVLTLLSVATASLILIIGIVLLTGLFLPGGIPENYRYPLGGIMTAYALYRIGTALSRLRRLNKSNDENNDNENESS